MLMIFNTPNGYGTLYKKEDIITWQIKIITVYIENFPTLFLGTFVGYSTLQISESDSLNFSIICMK